MIKRKNSHFTSRSSHQILKKNSFSINDSSSSIQTKKLRNKKSYKEIYLDKMGIATSISVSRKNYSLLTKSFNDSDDKEMTFKISRNNSSNNNEIKTPKKNNSNSSFFLDASLSIRGKRDVESFASPINKNINYDKKNFHMKNVTNKKKKINLDEKNKNIHHNNKEKNKINNNINNNHNNKKTNINKNKNNNNNHSNNNHNQNKDDINKIEQLLDNNLFSENSSSSDKLNDSNNSLLKSQSDIKKQSENKISLKNKNFTLDEYENDTSPSLKGILLNKNCDTIHLLKRYKGRSKTVFFEHDLTNDKNSSNDSERKKKDIGTIYRSKTFKVEKISKAKNNENIPNQLKKIYEKFGLLENNKINNKNIKDKNNNNNKNLIINKLKENNNKIEENKNKLKDNNNNNKNNENNLSSGKIILTDEKGNIVNQNESYDFQNTKKSEGKFSIITNESPNKNNNLKTESNEESINNSKNDNKKFEDEEEDLGEERVRAFDDYNNKKEKNVDTINELDEEYESDFTNQRIKNTLKKSNLNTLESVKNKKKDIINNDKNKINNFDDFDSLIFNNNKLFDTQSDFFNQNYSPLIGSLDKKNNLKKNIEIMNPNIMNKIKFEKKKNPSYDFDKINSFVKMMRNKNNKQILSYNDKEKYDEINNRKFERELYNEKRKQKIENIKNILTDSNDNIDEDDKLKRKTFRNLVKITNSVSSIYSNSKDLNPIKNQKKLVINHHKKNSYSFKNDLNNNNNNNYYNSYYNNSKKNNYYNNNNNNNKKNNYYNNNNYNNLNNAEQNEDDENNNNNIKYLYSNKNKSNDILFPLSYHQYYQYFGNHNNNLNELDNKYENKINYKNKNNNINTDENFYNINKYNNDKKIPKIHSYIEKRKFIQRPFEKCYIMPVNPMEDVLIAKENCIYEINNL